MLKTFYLYMGCLLSALFGIVLWKNCVSYRERSWKFKILKSFGDWSLISLLAWKLPALLVAWAVNWVTFPITDRNTRVTLSVFAGIAFSTLHTSILELLALLSVFSVDIITGNNGFIGHLDRGRKLAGI